ncbi:MAG: hypothetical protein HXS46_05855 [Theionarchaea archaeon]|nr:hypothetical protein [Theionarchaea archaeon]
MIHIRKAGFGSLDSNLLLYSESTDSTDLESDFPDFFQEEGGGIEIA